MEKFYPLLLRTTLFQGVDPAGLDRMLTCFGPTVRAFQKGELLLLSGYANRDVGILLEGEIEAAKTTPDGGSVSIAHMGPGSLFGDVLSGSTTPSPVTVSACTPCRVMFLPYDKIVHPCACLHSCHSLLLQNLIASISDKYFALNRRLDLLILKSLRAKVCAWLLEQSAAAGSDTFSTTLSRARLADYLNCERSALSRELGRMQREGLLETYRGSFRLLNKDAIRREYRA